MDINDKVKILPFSCEGFILGIYTSNAPTKYLVRYFMDGDIKEEYYYGFEIIKY